jgi:hypothetical protein
VLTRSELIDGITIAPTQLAPQNISIAGGAPPTGLGVPIKDCFEEGC